MINPWWYFGPGIVLGCIAFFVTFLNIVENEIRNGNEDPDLAFAFLGGCIAIMCFLFFWPICIVLVGFYGIAHVVIVPWLKERHSMIEPRRKQERMLTIDEALDILNKTRSEQDLEQARKAITKRGIE